MVILGCQDVRSRCAAVTSVLYRLRNLEDILFLKVLHFLRGLLRVDWNGLLYRIQSFFGGDKSICSDFARRYYQVMIFDDHNRLHVFNFGLLHKSFVVFRAHIFPLSDLSNVSIWLAVVRRVFSASFYRGYLWQSCVGFRCVSVCCLPVSSNWQSNTWRFYGDVLPPFDHTWYSLIYIQTLQALFLDDSGRF